MNGLFGSLMIPNPLCPIKKPKTISATATGIAIRFAKEGMAIAPSVININGNAEC